MADVHTPAVRSRNMSRIKGKDTKPELLVRKFLHSRGFRFNLHGNYKGNKLPGKPDIVLPKYKTVVFVNGCFWHGHENCKYFKWPITRTQFWREKIGKNKERDRKYQIELTENLWKVILIWECELKPNKIKRTLDDLEVQVKYGNSNY